MWRVISEEMEMWSPELEPNPVAPCFFPLVSSGCLPPLPWTGNDCWNYKLKFYFHGSYKISNLLETLPFPSIWSSHPKTISLCHFFATTNVLINTEIFFQRKSRTFDEILSFCLCSTTSYLSYKRSHILKTCHILYKFTTVGSYL